MSPRKYDLGKRAEAAEATRRRIVEATFDLHAEKGVADTTFKDIAERADVSLATVYRYFPAYDDVVQACGALHVERDPLPDPAAVAGADDPVAALVDAVYAFYDDQPGMLAMLRNDRRRVPSLGGFVDAAEQLVEACVRAALPRSDDDAVVTVLALLDEGVHRSLTASGLNPADARERIAGVIRKAIA